MAFEVTASPLYVDLDGTFSTTDTFWEGVASVARDNPKALVHVALAARKGRQAIKSAVSDAMSERPPILHVNEDVVTFLEAEKDKRPLILATAATRAVADYAAKQAGFFDAVLASDQNTNLKGSTKLEAIEKDALERTGASAFDYIGDSPADRPIWKKAGRAIVVAPNHDAAKDLADGVPVEKHIGCPKGGARAAIKSMRVHQWIKNVLVFVPAVLSHQVIEPAVFFSAFAIMVAMSLCASGTYIWNDILDLEADRKHRSKKNRPIASGQFPIARALALSIALIAAASMIALITGGLILLATLYGYVVLTLGYSFVLKRKLLLDAIALGGLFAYRVFLGGVATNILVSDWLIAFCIFFFLGLALAKRYVEIDASDAPEEDCIPGRGYRSGDGAVILSIGTAVTYISVIVLSLYTTSEDVAELYARPVFLWGVSLTLIYWTGRLWTIAHRKELNDDPIVFAVKDRHSYVCALLCGLSLFAAGPL